MTFLPVSHMFQRASLGNQVATIIRQGIGEGRWTGELPTEAALCRDLQVSRVTLRKALTQLASEQWIELAGRGFHHRILKHNADRLATTDTIIRVLTPYNMSEMGPIHQAVFGQIGEQLSSSGYRLEFELRPHLFERHQPALLRRLANLPETAAWLLFFSTEAMQRWFSEHGAPCVVVGRTHDAIPLSCVYPDSEAKARHAAGLFVARGHRDLAYLMADFTSVGDRQCSHAFAAEARRLGANVTTVTHGADMPSVSRAIVGLLAARPRPTGFFSNCPEHCITALCQFLSAGLRVPTDVSLIAGWDDWCLQYTVPTIARYRVDSQQMSRKISNRLLDILRHGTTKVHASRILPDFVDGGTLDPGPDQGRNG